MPGQIDYDIADVVIPHVSRAWIPNRWLRPLLDADRGAAQPRFWKQEAIVGERHRDVPRALTGLVDPESPELVAHVRARPSVAEHLRFERLPLQDEAYRRALVPDPGELAQAMEQDPVIRAAVMREAVAQLVEYGRDWYLNPVVDREGPLNTMLADPGLRCEAEYDAASGFLVLRHARAIEDDAAPQPIPRHKFHVNVPEGREGEAWAIVVVFGALWGCRQIKAISDANRRAGLASSDAMASEQAKKLITIYEKHEGSAEEHYDFLRRLSAALSARIGTAPVPRPDNDAHFQDLPLVSYRPSEVSRHVRYVPVAGDPYRRYVIAD